MAKRVIDDSTLTAVADKIRERVPDLSGASMTPLEMPEKIDYVYDRGKQVQYNEFWDNYQQNGNRTEYDYCFAGYAWNKNNLKPKHKIKPTSAASMFFQCGYREQGTIDLREVDIDFSSCTNFSSCFRYANGIGAIGKIYNNNNYVQNTVFQYCEYLHTIELYHIGVSCTFSNTFDYCSRLKNITIGGLIQNSISFAQSPLTKESITSIIEHLSSGVSGKTLSLKKTAVNNAFTVCAYSLNRADELSDIGNWEPVMWLMGIGDAVDTGACVYISFADTNIIVRKAGDSYFEDVNEGSWELVAHGTDVKDEWGDLVKSKPNWTINLI